MPGQNPLPGSQSPSHCLGDYTDISIMLLEVNRKSGFPALNFGEDRPHDPPNAPVATPPLLVRQNKKFPAYRWAKSIGFLIRICVEAGVTSFAQEGHGIGAPNIGRYCSDPPVSHNISPILKPYSANSVPQNEVAHGYAPGPVANSATPVTIKADISPAPMPRPLDDHLPRQRILGWPEDCWYPAERSLPVII